MQLLDMLLHLIIYFTNKDDMPFSPFETVIVMGNLCYLIRMLTLLFACLTHGYVHVGIFSKVHHHLPMKSYIKSS